MQKAKKNARIAIPAAVVAAFLGSFGAQQAAAEPAIVKAVAPDYPRAAERRNIEGAVVVVIDVAADGSVAGVRVQSSNPAGIFDSSAVNAVKRWKFESGMAQSITKTIQFQLQG